MSVRIGFHGFGRLGRNVFRVLANRRDFDVRCIADVAKPENLIYLLNFDSIHGRYPEEVTHTASHIFVGGRAIPYVHSREPGEVRWRDYDVDVVVEASGRYRTLEALDRHLEAGARRVVLTVPPRGTLEPVYCVGVNDATIDRSTKIVSNGSCTSNALAVILNILDEAFGVERASMTLNVPIPDGSVIDLTTVLQRKTSAEDVNGVVRSAARGRLKGILEYCEQPVVSSDVIGNVSSGVFDSLMTRVLDDDMVKTVTWYDNGWGYANRVVDLIERMAETL